MGVVSSILHILFLLLFESSVSFIFWIGSLATCETIIAVLFLLVFWFLLLLESYIYIYIYIYIYCAAKLVLFAVAQEPQEGEMRGVSM